MNDPYRAAEHWTPCPRCGTALGWNTEDGLGGQSCACGYTFSGREWTPPTSAANPDERELQAKCSACGAVWWVAVQEPCDCPDDTIVEVSLVPFVTASPDTRKDSP